MHQKIIALYHYCSAILAEMLFPESCAGCGKTDTALCAFCIKKVSYLREPAEEPWIFPVASYHDPILYRVIIRAKYAHRPQALLAFGSILADRVSEATVDETILTRVPWILVPIPITKDHYRKRGYNQSQRLAQSIISQTSPSLYTIRNFLKRKNGTKSQARISHRKDRLKNPRDTFSVCNAPEIIGCNIVLIDDVVTTGATLREARRMLLNAGAKEVIAVTLAYTEKRS
jgi:competence protein ComFC